MTWRGTVTQVLELPAFQKTALALLLAVFYAIHLIVLPVSEIVNFIPDDAFFYPKIIQNYLLGYGVTFDRIVPTTGFHWGWFCILGVWLKFFSLLDPAVLTSPNALLMTSMAAVFGVKLIEAWLTIVLLTHLTGRHPLLPLLVLFLAVRIFLYDSLMETDLLVAMLLGCTLLFVLERKNESVGRRGVLQFLMAYGTVFTRIDYAFLFFLLLIVSLLRLRFRQVTIPAIVKNFFLGAVAAVAASVALDYAVAGLPVSTSALLKSYAMKVSFSRLIHAGRFVLPMDAACLLLTIIIGTALFIRFEKFREVVWPIAPVIGGITVLLVFQVAVNNLIASWYFDPFLYYMYLFAGAIVVFMAKNFAPMGRRIAYTIAIGAMLIFFSRQTLRQETIVHTPVYNFAVMLKNACGPNDTIFAEDYCGMLSFFSNRKVVSGDGLVNSSDYIRKYLLTGNVAAYLRENKIAYHVVTTMTERQFSSQAGGPEILDTLKPFFLNVPPSVITLERKNQVLSYDEGEHGRFFALFKLQ